MLCLQIVLLLEPRKVRLFNVTSKSEEPESLPVDTAGKQWLVTPNGAALLALRYSHAPSAGGTPGWVLDAYTLEDCQPMQSVFEQIADSLDVAADMHRLPALVRACCRVKWQAEVLSHLETLVPAHP